MSKSDDEFYARLERKRAKRDKRIARLASTHPQRMDLIQRVRAGEITLEDAKSLARKL
jgi:hypothetical protein